MIYSIAFLNLTEIAEKYYFYVILFFFMPIFAGPNLLAQSPVYVKISDATLYLHAHGGSNVGAIETLHPCPKESNFPNCQWIFERSVTTPGAIYIKSKGGFYLHANGGSNPGATMTLHPCPKENDHPNCQWVLEPSQSKPGAYYIKSLGANLYLHAHGGSNNGATMTLHPCPKDNDHPNCQWELDRGIRNIDLEFVYDQQLSSDLATIEEEIEEAIEYGNMVFKNSNLPYRLRWINKGHRIRYDFKGYYEQSVEAVKKMWVHLRTDMTNPRNNNSDLWKSSRAWLGNLQPNPRKIVVLLIDGFTEDQGAARAIDIGEVSWDNPFVWVQSKMTGPPGKWVLVHEVAHIFGATHCASLGGEHPDEESQFQCSDELDPEDGRRTVMSKNWVNNKDLIPYFSGFASPVDGKEIGDASHDNTATLRTNINKWLDQERIRPELLETISAVSWSGGHQTGIYGIDFYGSDFSGIAVGSTGIRGWVNGDSQALGTPISSTSGSISLFAISAISWTDNKYGIYALGRDGNVYQRWWDGLYWSGWGAIGSPGNTKLKAISAVSWAENQYGLYATGEDGKVYQKWWNGSNWSGWGSIGGPKNTRLAAISAVSWTGNQYGIYAAGEDGKVYQKWWNGSNWSEWGSIGGPGNTRLAAISAVSWTGNQYGIYATGEDGKVYQKWWNGSKWSGWGSIGGPQMIRLEAIAAVSLPAKQYALYAFGEDGRLYRKRWLNVRGSFSWENWNLFK